ncbi:hypothetical protein BH23ACT2_BH23ACT2_12330 [soil metagenome]
MSDRSDGEPEDDAYGRVTDPEQWRALHDATTRLIEELTDGCSVTRTDAVDLDPWAAGMWPGSPATRLEPRSGGSVITFTFTSHPGVMVSYGHAGSDAFPRCGCDACDEDPGEEAKRMADVVRDVVSGGFTETRTRRRLRADAYESRLDAHDPSGWSGRDGTVDAEANRAAVPIGTTRRPAWTS